MEMIVKVGPYGKRQGNLWNDKGQSMLTNIFISYDTIRIKSIQTAYMLGGKLQLSDKHGGDGVMFKTVEIDYPSEFLIGITGYTSADGLTDDSVDVINSLTFETNRRKFGPFGPEVPASLLNKRLQNLLYMDPKNGMEMMVKFGPRGWGGLGTHWDDKGQSMLTQIFISYDSKRVYSIQTAYMLDGKLQLSNKHGGDGDMFKTVEIDYPSEFLTGISGYKDSLFSDYMVKSLTFETNRRKFGPFGQEEGTHFCIELGSKRFFGGFHGTSDSNYLLSIGVYVKPINPSEEETKIQSTVPIKARR
ncbi:jacalin-related lectin 3-like [Telopea speciosissima]|uniref:jacalin-related lectin 3-like n=1 Tax=Telopea speciosissima TaxID=54955 RepID=UPI001CC462CA|nr:jacalin-related lectin 3-like [Telopea speciosissima]